MRESFELRVRIMSLIIIAVAAVLVSRLWVLQVANGEEFARMAERQYVAPTDGLYDRGTIFFEDKDGHRIAGATLKSGFLVAINPGDIANPEVTYSALSKLIELDQADFFMRAAKKDDPYEEIAREVEADTASKIEKLNLPGVHLHRERWRYNPGGSLASQTLGFVAYSNDALSGQYGLERYYDDVLSRNNTGMSVNFFAELFSNLNEKLFASERARAGSIVTSIEPSVQLQLEEELSNLREKTGAKLAGGIVMDPSTGYVQALAVTPSFDVNHFEDVENPHDFVNPLVESVYEMGSIIKPITMAIGLDAGVVTSNSTYYDPGRIEIDGYTISNYDGVARGTVSMQEVLNQSLNTGASYVVDQVGTREFAEYMKKFGLGEETGIDLPNEARGLIDNLDSPGRVGYATASFGQGIAMTPIETVRALAALANRGVLVTPKVTKQIIYESGDTKDISYGDEERVISEETGEEITRMLVNVVDDALRGGDVALERYSIAAKTGTAQIAQKNARGYYDDRYLHSFFGYFPAYEPRFIVFLYVVEPQGSRYASETLTAPFMDMTKFLINYYELPPDR